jgi:hypothetical protein
MALDRMFSSLVDSQSFEGFVKDLAYLACVATAQPVFALQMNPDMKRDRRFVKKI